jgi:hypothetical protein
MRCALSYWSQNSGSRTIGLPKCSASVVVLLPPCVITGRPAGCIVVCGRNSAPHHVVGELVEVGLRALAHDVAVRRAAEHVDQPPHQVDVGAARAIPSDR